MTGITAFTACVAGLAPTCVLPVALAYRVVSPALLKCREKHERQTHLVGTLELQLFSWQLPGGVTADRARVAALPAGTNYYLSGRPGMIDAVTDRLPGREVAPENVGVDAWV